MSMQALAPLQLPLRGIQLIEASAGTGKTWTIAALYLRLVLGHGTAMPLLPSQILVLTFTKASTAELRDRIRARLAEAALAFRHPEDADPFLRDLMAAYPDPAARALAARQLELAAQWMDEAAIHTIHGWSQRMLVQHAFDSGHAFDQDTDIDESELLAEAVRDYWRLECLTLDRHSAAQLQRWWASPEDLQRDVRDWVRKPEAQWRLDGKPLPASASIRELLASAIDARTAAEALARGCWREHRHSIERLMWQATEQSSLNANSYKPARLPSDLGDMANWSEGAPIDASVLERFQSSKLARATRKGATTPEHEAFARIEALLECEQALGDLAPRVLAHAIPWLAHRIDDTKQRRAQLGFDDMLKRFDQALQGISGHRLAATVTTQYPIALIDEFQDTDPLQWRIFSRLYADRPELGLLLIGDPKQAIYGFRGADIHTYLRAREHADRPMWTLQTNYRSTASLVQAVNHVFARADAFPAGAFGFGHGASGLPFQPALARGRDDRLTLDGEDMPALQWALLEPGQLVGSTRYREHMAAHAAAWLVELLAAAREGRCGFASEQGDLRALQPSDIAILVRKGAEASAMRHALSQRGLKSVYLSDRDSVFAAAEAQDLLLWLRACAEPASDRAMRAALATPGLGMDYAGLDRLNSDEAHWEAMGQRFQAFHDTWLHHGVLAMLHDVLHAFDVPARWLARVDGERALTNLLHLAELLQHASTTLDGQHALIRYLAEQIADAAAGQMDTAEEQIVRLESEADLIKVVTIHKSKGLEYPLVLLPFASAPARASDTVVWHADDGSTLMDLLPSDEARLKNARESLQEDLRLLYVALTRPRYACWIGVAAINQNRSKSSCLHDTAVGYLLHGGESIDAAQLPALLSEATAGSPDASVRALPRDPSTTALPPARDAHANARTARHYAGKPQSRWWIASYTALRYSEEVLPTDIPAPETATQARIAELAPAPPEPSPAVAAGIHAFPAGAVPGTFLHDLLEWVAEQGFAAVAADPALAAEEIARRAERRDYGLHVETLRHWLRDWLHAPLPVHGEPISLGRLPPSPAYRAELEFWFSVDHVDTLALDRLVCAHTLGARPRVPLLRDQLNGMLKGFIDLLFEHEGRYYVVDYKSNKLGADATSYTADAVRDSVLRERYDLQYAIYTLALHRQLRVRLPDYDYERHVGGVMYLYLRGIDGPCGGIHQERLPYALVEAMDALFAGQEAPTHA